MIYKVRHIIEPMIEFIKTIPFLGEFHIDMRQIDTQQFDASRAPGTALDFVGSAPVTDVYDAQGNRFVTRQANFQLWLLRESGANLFRTEVAEFLFNLEQWIEHQQFYGLTPKIGDDPQDEIMWADNGMYFAEWEGETASQYMIQIHITYQNYYEEDN